jgi:hypothetical protein
MTNDNAEDFDQRRAEEDELIRQFLRAQAREWAEREREYGFTREPIRRRSA